MTKLLCKQRKYGGREREEFMQREWNIGKEKGGGGGSALKQEAL